MTTTKMTRREILNAMLATAEIAENPIFVDYIEKELAKLDKKASESKPTKTQEANAILKTNILEAMEAETLYTITDLLKVVPACADLSNQKVSAVVRQMVDEKTVEKIVEKRTSYFKRA